MAGYWPSSFFRVRLGLYTREKRTRPITNHLARTNLVNKGFIIWLSGKFFLRDTGGSPERARCSARPSSQSHCAMCCIFPGRGACHIIKCSINRLLAERESSIGECIGPRSWRYGPSTAVWSVQKRPRTSVRQYGKS